MADNSEKQMIDNVLRLSRDLFASVIGHHGGHQAPKGLAARCIHFAEDFIEAEALYRAGVLDPPDDENPLDTAFAPNMKKTSPVNMMSREYGSVDKLYSILAEIKGLVKDGWDQVPEDAIVYEPLNWSVRDVRLALHLFPQKITEIERIKAQKEKTAVASKS